MKPCKTCPFLEGTENYGAPDWLEDVFNGIRRGVLDHTCHCADPKADGCVGAKRPMCCGIVGLMLNSGELVVPKALDIKLKDVDASQCFKTTKDFLLHHLKPIRDIAKCNTP